MHFMGRRVKPFAFVVLISMIGLVWFNARDADILDGSWYGDMVMFGAIISAVAMFFGWIFQINRMEEWGLALAAGVWAARTATALFLGQGVTPGVWFSFCWAAGCIGAFLFEILDPSGQKVEKVK